MANAIETMGIFLMNNINAYKNVWDTFDFNTFKDFHNDHFKKYLLLLAEIFEKFIFTCLKYYDLDPCH